MKIIIKCINLIIVFLSILTFHDITAQEKPASQNTTPSLFRGWWINKAYMIDLCNKVTPKKATGSGFVYLSFTNNNVMIASINESWYRNLEVVSATEISILDYYGKDVQHKVRLLDTGSDQELILNEKIVFKRYPEKYGSRSSNKLVNEIFFVGTYISDNPDRREITFSIDGKISGFEDYVRYRVICNYLVPPSYETVIFYKEGQRRGISYNWKVEGDTLFLYEDKPDERHVENTGELLLKLIKKKK
ncbi:hypothetical protein ACFL6O_01470 [candidate division KSB1 bacterium]